MLKANPPVFWPKRPSEAAVVVAGAGVPKEKPLVLAAGALKEQEQNAGTLKQTLFWLNKHKASISVGKFKKSTSDKRT